MILPGSYEFSLALLILGMLCWGTWANTQKMAGPKWRFELYYIDFAIGTVLAAVIAGLTLGTLGWDGFSLVDDLKLAGKKQDLFAFTAGCVFNLANFLLVAAISIAGMSASFPVTMGVGLITAVLTALLLARGGPGVPFISAGCALILIAVALAVQAWSDFTKARLAAVPERPGGKAPRKFSFKGIAVAGIGGLLMGSFLPLIRKARFDENGLGPYSLCFVFAIGILASTLVFELFFMNIPLQGKAIGPRDFFKGSVKQHLLGITGGVLWLTGALAGFVVFRADAPAQVTPAATFAIAQAAPVLAALCGIFVWKEMAGAGARVRAFMAASLLLYLGGIALVSTARLR